MDGLSYRQMVLKAATYNWTLKRSTAHYQVTVMKREKAKKEYQPKGATARKTATVIFS